MGQDPKLFNDPQQFNPDRWATDDIHPFAIILHAFGFGPRGCWDVIANIYFNTGSLLGRRFVIIGDKNFIVPSNNIACMYCNYSFVSACSLL